MINIGVVGCGYWGPNLVRNLVARKETGTVTICDRDPARTERLYNQYPVLNVAESYDAMTADPAIDAVVVATPVTTHAPLGLQALKAGKHVFIEKPMASSSGECSALIEAASAAGRTLMVGHTFMYSPPVLRIKDELVSGSLGDVFYISATRVNLGLHQKDVSVIWDLAPHDFSILFYWLEETPVRVSVMGKDFVQSGIPDVAFVNMEFASGCIAHVQLSWLAPSKLRRTTIVGDKKMLVYDDTESFEKVKIYDKGVDYRNPGTFGEYQLSYRTGDIVSPQLPNYEPLGAEMGHFVESIQKGTPPITDGQAGLDVVRVLEAAEKSLHAGGKVIDV